MQQLVLYSYDFTSCTSVLRECYTGGYGRVVGSRNSLSFRSKNIFERDFASCLFASCLWSLSVKHGAGLAHFGVMLRCVCIIHGQRFCLCVFRYVRGYNEVSHKRIALMRITLDFLGKASRNSFFLTKPSRTTT